MNKEELEKEAEEKYSEVDREFIACQDEGEVFNIGYILGAESREKRIAELTEWLNEASDEKLKLQMLRVDLVSKIGNQEKRITELEEKISVLLSCKNCPENKGGYICEKEYENKCLAQNMQYINELQEENAELKAQLESERDLPAIAYMQGAEKQKKKDEEQIAKAKALLKQWLLTSKASSCDNINIVTDTEQFLKEVEK